ncbi:MAG TPA: hypothetical protein VH593_12890, partial [Ktedonobacteraceae bacterium]
LPGSLFHVLPGRSRLSGLCWSFEVMTVALATPLVGSHSIRRRFMARYAMPSTTYFAPEEQKKAGYRCQRADLN